MRIQNLPSLDPAPIGSRKEVDTTNLNRIFELNRAQNYTKEADKFFAESDKVKSKYKLLSATEQFNARNKEQPVQESQPTFTTSTKLNGIVIDTSKETPISRTKKIANTIKMIVKNILAALAQLANFLLTPIYCLGAHRL